MQSSSSIAYPLRHFKYDLTAGMVVFLVAVPLCLGIALASGAPLLSGLIAGVIGGVVVGVFSQSAVSVSGPAAGMVAVVLAALSNLQHFNVFLLALFVAGLLQVLLGYLRAGFIADYIPSNVIQGLLCAIGILVIVRQLLFAFTYTEQSEKLLELFKLNAETFNWESLPGIYAQLNPGATLIAVASLATLIYLDKTKNVLLRKFPGPIVVVMLGILANELFSNYFPALTQYSNELVNIPVHDSWESLLSNMQWPAWSSWRNPKVYWYAMILAAVASLEALLNLEGIEKLDKQRRYCSRDRELIAQGLGNSLSGLVGGIPITSVIIRGSVNIQAGSRSKLSTIIHGFFILFVTLLIPKWINLIPLASLAAILIYVGYKLTRPAIYVEMYQQGFTRFLPFLVTVLAIVFTDLLTGILIGLLTSFFFILKSNSEIMLDIINEKHPFGTVRRMILPQHMSFLRKASMVAELESIPPRSHFIVDARYSQYIDQDILEVLNVFQKNQAPGKQIALNMVGFKDKYEIHDRIDFVNVTTYDTQAHLTSDEVLDLLREGNNRFVNDTPIHRSLLDEIRATSRTQFPMAIVLGCIDSRVPVETIFDMGVGDVFVARIAGNVCNNDIIASMEFACHLAGAKLIVVLGHTFCGAIKAACGGPADGYLHGLLEKIQPAIQAETETRAERHSDNKIFLTNVTRLNVRNTLQTIMQESIVLREMIKAGQVGIVGALYDVSTGVVTFEHVKPT